MHSFRQVGDHLQQGLHQLASRHSGKVLNVRGMGTLCAFDMPEAGVRDKLLAVALTNGLHIGGCGDVSVRFRPALVFEKNHVDLMLAVLDKSLAQMK